MMKPHPNPCPKADRYIHAAECICYDTFRGEYLCFDSRTYSNYEAKGTAAKPKLKKKRRIKWQRHSDA